MIRSSSRLKQSKEKLEAGILDTKFFSDERGGFAKRLFDFIAAFIGLILLTPIFMLIGFLIKRDSPGPVFYRGPRIGRHGVVFQMLKFRTMYETPESYLGPRVTCKEDERITSLGKWLRDTKLNELPQLWNVLKGEMSLVGPRPEDPTLSRTWPTNIARELLSVRPGVTSPASILYRDEESMLHTGELMRKYLHELSPDKMRLDQLYVKYRSLWLDLDVILWTIFLLMPKIKDYSPPEQLLFVGPVTRLFQRYLGWFLLDFVIVFLSISITTTIVRLFGPLEFGLRMSLGMALAYSAISSFIGMLLRTDRIDWPKATSWETGKLWAAWLIVASLALILHYSFGILSLRVYGIIIGASLLSLVGATFARYRGRLVNGVLSRLMASRLDSRIPRERILIVGSGRTAEHLAWLLDHPTYSRKFQVVGFIDDDMRLQGMKVYGARVIGRALEVQDLVKKYDIGLIILADSQMAARGFKDFRDVSKFKPARVVVAPDLFGSLSGLDGDSPSAEASDHLNDFQCRYCLARQANHQSQQETLPVVEFEGMAERRNPENTGTPDMSRPSE